jgi:5-methylthioribose kinase
MDDTDLLRYVESHLPDFVAAGSPVRMPEGNLNVVWRVPGEGGSLIVKHAPPYVAADPEVDLDPNRIVFELRSLEALSERGAYADVPTPEVRPPRPVYADPVNHVLVMEDLGDVPTLGRWLRSTADEKAPAHTPQIGQWLGAFIGRLHRSTLGDETAAETFDNRAMQETRHAIQYQAVADLLRRGGVADADVLGRRAEALGETLLGPGLCLTMGDLWPSSVLVAPDDAGLRLIDWELAHYGQPLQDLAHWEAHLWMQAHRAPTDALADAVRALRDRFWDAYLSTIGDDADVLWSDDMRRHASVHFGAEILARTTGRFQDGYLYDGLAPDAPPIQEAVTKAANAIRRPGDDFGF